MALIDPVKTILMALLKAHDPYHTEFPNDIIDLDNAEELGTWEGMWDAYEHYYGFEKEGVEYVLILCWANNYPYWNLMWRSHWPDRDNIEPPRKAAA